MSQFYSSPPGGTPSIPTQFTTDSGTAVASANNINVFGGTGATTSATGSTITVSVKTDGFRWSEQNADFSAAVQNGYFCNGALTITLPAGVAIGNTIIIYVDSNATTVVNAGVGQFIEIGGITSSSGGSATASIQGSMLGLVFKPTDSTWHAVESMGSWAVI